MTTIDLNLLHEANVNSKLTQLLDTLPHGVQECDLDGIITYSNRAHHQLLGFNIGEVVGHYVWDFQADESQKQQVKDYFYYLITEQPAPEPYITTNLTRIGQYKVVEINWDYLRNESGVLIGFISIISDITQRQKVEEELKDSERLFRELIETTGASAWELDIDSQKFTYMSPNILKVLGYKVEQWTDFNFWSDKIYDEDKKRALSFCNEETSKGKNHSLEYRMLNAKGEIIWIHDVVSVIFEQNKPAKLRGFFIDISAFKRKEQELIEHKLLLEEAQCIAHIGHWELNPNTLKAQWSNEIFHILGIDNTNNVGQELLATLLHPEDKERVLSSLQGALTEDKKHHMEYRIIQPNGEVRWVECRATRIQDDSGKLLKLRGIFKDISVHKKIEQELSNTLATLKNVIDSTPDLIFVKNHKLETILCNKAYAGAVSKTCEQMYGHTDIENGLDPKLVNGDPEKGIRGYELDDMDALSGMRVDYLCNLVNSDGEMRIFDAYKLPLIDVKNNIMGVLGVARDITEKKQADDELKLLSNVFTHASEGILITDADENILDVNEAFKQITGYSREEVLGQTPKFLNSGVHDGEFFQTMWQQTNNNNSWYGEIWNKRKNNELYAVNMNITVVEDEESRIKNYIAIFSDITDVKKHQEHLEYLAHYDVLTNLPNRVLLSNNLKNAMAQTNRNADNLTVAFLDLDNFKEVNDTYGHAIGDQILVSLTDSLQQHLRESDTLARIGGDEFVMVLSNQYKEQECIPLIKRLLTAASKPIQVGDNAVHLSASIGVTFFPQSEQIDADQLLRQADQAMYLAKQSGKNCYKIFDMSQDRFVRKRHESIGRIQQALENNEFVMFYQPKVNMYSGDIIGAEALIRWLHPETGLVPPGEFLPLIEDDFIAVKIGDWVISNTLSQLNKWHKSGLKLTISINISALHLQQSNFLDNLEKKLNEYPDINNHFFELEVLETSALDDINHVSEIMRSCQKLGVHFALDDFGTGYSSLTYLKRLPASTLKIDKTFVRDMLNDPDDLAIVEGILGLSAAFKRQSIAEGVETIEHGCTLLKMGCDLAQGYAIAKPMPADELLAWTRKWQQPESWKHIKRLDKEGISLLYAMVEQKSWLKELEFYVKDKTTVIPEISIDKCRFGSWMKSTGKQKYKHLTLFQKIDITHQKLHKVAYKMLQCKRKNDNKKLQDKLSLLKKTSNQLLKMLKQLI